MNHLLKEQSVSLQLGAYVIDWLSIIIAGIISFGLYLQHWMIRPDYVQIIALAVALSAWLFNTFDLYRVWRGVHFFSEVRRLFIAWTLVFLWIALYVTLTKSGAQFSRGWLLLWFLIGFLCLISFRFVLRLGLKYLREKGLNHRNVVIVGDAKSALELSKKIQSAPWAGFRVLRIFVSQESGCQMSNDNLISPLCSLKCFLSDNPVEQVWLCFPLREEKSIHRVLHDLRHEVLDIRFFPDLEGMRLINGSISDVIGLPVINISESPLKGDSFVIKELEDKLISAIVLVLLSPLFLFLALGVKLSSPGPIIYRQSRVSWNGKSFEMLKFRSMPVDTEINGATWGGSRALVDSRFGRFIRKTSLDELPQFVNVLRGDMSIVGPRPERTEFIDDFKDEIPDYMKKHLMKAGITGWAQINGLRGDTDLVQRIEHDIYYIDNWSIWFDLKIMVLTVYRGMTAENAY